jgi:excisionase family DNA binding protein
VSSANRSSLPGRLLAKLVLTHAPSDYISSGQRENTISRAKLETEVKRKPEAYMTEDQVRLIQAKEWLTLKEAALLLNVSPLTLRRWVLSEKTISRKIGRKHLFRAQELLLLK